MTDRRMKIKSPLWLKEMNEQLMVEHRDTLSVLTIAGRRSGEPRRTPLSVYEHEGRRYVVGGFPAADWIRNARAAEAGVLVVGDRSEDVRIVEVSGAEAELVLRAWPSFVPQGVEMMLNSGVITDTTPAALAEVVGICPVFRLDPAD